MSTIKLKNKENTKENYGSQMVEKAYKMVKEAKKKGYYRIYEEAPTKKLKMDF